MEVKKVLAYINSFIIASSLCLTGVFAQSNELNTNVSNEINYQIPKVSVVVPVYNGEKYLDKCLDSLTSQTLNDIEIICVNDGSKDNSLNKLKEHQEKDPRIIIIDQKNSGEAGARQRGLDEAKGEYVAFVDQDDYVDKNAYETAYNSIIENDADIVVYGWRNFTEGNNKIIRNDCKFNNKIIFEDWFEAKTERASIYVWNKLYKRSLITDNNIRFDIELKVCGDECFNMCVYPFAKKIVHIPYTFYNYRMNNNSSLFNFSFRKVITNYSKMWYYVNTYYKDRKIRLPFYKKIIYFKIYKDEFFPIIKTWLGFSK
ncbi:MAG: glycosyltransferase [Clostridia bacterium]|nr:glycosyltransferase [Clostridia bacterium]